jgi:predicted restriction endonuclease
MEDEQKIYNSFVLCQNANAILKRASYVFTKPLCSLTRVRTTISLVETLGIIGLNDLLKVRKLGNTPGHF